MASILAMDAGLMLELGVLPGHALKLEAAIAQERQARAFGMISPPPNFARGAAVAYDAGYRFSHSRHIGDSTASTPTLLSEANQGHGSRGSLHLKTQVCAPEQHDHAAKSHGELDARSTSALSLWGSSDGHQEQLSDLPNKVLSE